MRSSSPSSLFLAVMSMIVPSITGSMISESSTMSEFSSTQIDVPSLRASSSSRLATEPYFSSSSPNRRRSGCEA